MKRLQHISVLSAFLCLAAVPLAQAQSKAAEEWKVSTSSEGRFKIALPAGKEQRQTLDLDIPSMGQVKFHVFGVENEGGNRAYLVMYCDYPVEGLSQDDAQQALESGRDAALKQLNAESTRERKITLAGHSGLEFHFTGNGQGRSVHGAWRLYLVRNRLYQVAALRFGQALPAADINRFFDSFKLTEGVVG
jgi:hypothetical protein